MKGREGKAAPSADLLVCFPSRAHLTLMPKPICSPARPSEPSKRHQHQHQHHQHHHNHPHHLKKSSTRNGGQASPLLWAKTKPMGTEISEPTSPKVTCAGQIKVRHKTSSCKNWQSVMEEIERIHNNKKHKKRPTWVEALGFKKEIMQFLTCLRSIRFDFRCFGSFPESGNTSDDEEEDGDQYQHNQVGVEESDDNETSRTIFSKWFMVLQENQSCGSNKEEIKEKSKSYGEESAVAPSVPPPNALLLMRCRSAPSKSWLEEKDKEKEKEEEEEEDQEAKKAMLIMEEENKKKKENLVVMKYNNDFYKFSSDIAKETWVVGGARDPLSRSRSWKR